MRLRRAGSPLNCALAARRAMLVLTLLLAADLAQAAVYKWVDASGHTVYSDQPPPGGIKSEVVSTSAVGPADPAALRDLANKDLELKRRVAQRNDDEKAADKARSDEVKQRANCVQLRNSLLVNKSSARLYQVNEKGERVYLDDAAKVIARERLEGQIRDQCADLNN
jgi:hypothetical protein